MTMTKLSNLINPQVMADMISSKVTKKISVIPFAKTDTTLQGRAGNTITIPVFGYIGDATTVAEGASIGAEELTTTDRQFTVQKIAKGVDLTDEALLSGYGDPVGEANRQLSMAISQKIDQDAIDALYGATLKHDGLSSKINYAGIVDAIDVFEEEFNTQKVIFVNPKQVSQIRKDTDFLSNDKYAGNNYISISGEIGKIANCRVVVSKRVKENELGTGYVNPIVKINFDTEVEEDTPALTIFLKKGVSVETDRDIDKQVNMIRASEHYVVALTDESKVVLATFKK
ncbi:N4-gp56 family major capsid protein [Clostridium butyricum]